MQKNAQRQNGLKMTKIDLFNHGYVELLNTTGTELDVVNVAKVSFNKTANEWDTNSEKLFNYLWEHGHTSPFRHVSISFRVHAPLPIVRQWEKYRVGSPIDTPSNEISGRYVEFKEEFFKPDQWRYQSKVNKQGSVKSVDDEELSKKAFELLEMAQQMTSEVYHELLSLGIAREQARFALTQSQYTTFIWTPTLQAVMHFLQQRLSHDAQNEIVIYARAVYDLLLPLFPRSMKNVMNKIEPHYYVATENGNPLSECIPMNVNNYQVFIPKDQDEKIEGKKNGEEKSVVKIKRGNSLMYCYITDLRSFQENGWEKTE